MKSKLALLCVAAAGLSACLPSSDDDGNPNEGAGVVNLHTSQMGSAGGFVDVNGDGKQDLIVGAPQAKASKGMTGAAGVFLANEHGFHDEPDAFLQGQGKGDFFGFSFANLGDVNGDDKSDFAIGAINAEGEAGMSGAVYVYEGGTNPPKLLAKLNGQNAFDKFGYSIAGADVNGDGTNDVIVSAPYTFKSEEDGAIFQSGGAYVYFGGATLSSTADVVVSGTKVNASMGQSVAAGDINGDDIADIIVDAGAKVFVYYGGTDLKARIEADATPDVNVRSDAGAHGGSGFGWSVAYVGDINQDGFGDFAVGNPRRSNPSTYDNVGSFYIFKGGAELPAEFFEDDATQRLIKIRGANVDDRFAASITVAGDLDDDGVNDLLVGAPWGQTGSETEPKLITGSVYLFYGKDLIPEDNTADQLVTLAHHVVSEEESSAGFGAFVAVDGENMLVGSPYAAKHNGDVHLKNVMTGNAASAGNSTGDADPHAGHH